MSKPIYTVEKFQEEVWYPAIEMYGKEKGIKTPSLSDYPNGISNEDYFKVVQEYALALYKIALTDKEFIDKVTEPLNIAYKIEYPEGAAVIYFKVKD